MSNPREYRFPEDGACVGHPEPWIFDGPIGGIGSGVKESPRARQRRHAKALAVCAICPVTEACLAAVDWAAGDEGVRGGVVLRENHNVGGYGDAAGASRRRRAS